MTLAVLSVMVLSALAQGKFSIRAEQQLSALMESQTRGAASVKKTLTVYTHEAMEASNIAERIKELGGHVSVVIGHCITATLPVELWQTVAGWEEVRAIDALSERGGMFLDKAHAYTKTSLVSDATAALTEGLPQGYTGKGTLMAIVDTGIDFNHAAFRTADNHTRIVYGAVLSYNEGGQKMIDEYVYSHEDLENRTCEYRPNTSISHGTHTSSIAGGSGMTNGKNRGVAPEAGLILIDLSDFTDGAPTGIYEAVARAIQIVDSVATSLDMPVSLSFSVGASGGAMDGISPDQEAIAVFTDKGTRPGRCVSVATGNSGIPQGHLKYTFTSDTDTIRSVIGKTTDMKNLQCVEIWGKDETPVTVRLVARNKNYDIVGESSYYTTDNFSYEDCNIIFEETDDTLACSVWYGFDVVHNRSYFSTTHRVLSSENVADALLEIEVVGKENATIDMMHYYNTVWFDILGADEWSKMGVELPETVAKTYREGDREQLANSMSISPYVISVGCGITAMDYKKKEAPEEDMVPPAIFGPLGLQIGDPTAWSNYSTWYSDHSVPHLIAPGGVILAAINSHSNNLEVELYENDEYYGEIMPYGLNMGTSMATPYVAGTAALLLQQNPNYSITEIRDLMMQNTQNKEHLHNLSVNPAQYGAGFLDVLATMKAANAGSSAIENVKDAEDDAHAQTQASQTYNLFGQPSKGEGFVVRDGRVVLKK